VLEVRNLVARYGDAQALWGSTAKAFPSSCDAPFAILASKGGLSDAMRWERIDKAAAEWDAATMRNAARGLPADQLTLANDYAAFFDAVNDRALAWPKTPRSRMMACHASPVRPLSGQPGDEVRSGADAPIKSGNAMTLRHVPVGSIIHNVEMKPGRGGQLARSAGSGIQLVAKDDGYGVLRLPSGEMRRVPLTCRATVGQVGNADHENQSGGKAGRSRWRGKRPSVRGSAMNPVDHPHGGGEGKSKGGRHPVTPWGVPTLGKRTRRKHKESDKLIVRGRRRGKEKR